MKLPRNRAFWILTGLGLLVGGCFFSKTSLSGYKDGVATRGTIAIKILSTGIVQPETRLEIKAPVGGRVEELLANEGQVIKKGQVIIRMSSPERAALLDAARAISPEELKKWEEYYKPAPLLSPLNGTIIATYVKPGQTVSSSDGLVAISDRLTVKAQVDETDIAEIQLKQRALILLDAYPTQAIEGRVDQIAYEARTINNVTTYLVDILPDKAPHFMRAGMTANVSFAVRSKDNIITVPIEAIKTVEGKSFVFMRSAEDKNKAIEKTVELGATDGKIIEIVQGLSENEKILIPQVNPRSLSKGNSRGGSPLNMGGRRH